MDTQKYVFTEEDIQNNKVIAALSYLGILFFLPLVVCPQSEYGKFHANQALLFFLTCVIGGFVANLIPLVSLITGPLFSLAMIVFGILRIVNTLNGKSKELPAIGHLRLIK